MSRESDCLGLPQSIWLHWIIPFLSRSYVEIILGSASDDQISEMILQSQFYGKPSIKNNTYHLLIKTENAGTLNEKKRYSIGCATTDAISKKPIYLSASLEVTSPLIVYCMQKFRIENLTSPLTINFDCELIKHMREEVKENAGLLAAHPGRDLVQLSMVNKSFFNLLNGHVSVCKISYCS